MRLALVSINCNDRHYSLATYSLAAMVRRHLPDIDVRVCNYSILQTARHILFDLLTAPADIYGLTVHHGHGAKTLEVARDIRRIQPDARFIVGGTDAVALSAEDLDGLVDFCVIGEGEWGLLHYLRALSANEEPAPFPNLVRPADLGGAQALRLEQEKALDLFPSPYLDGVFDAYDRYPTVYMETYRGCVWNCSFCFEGRGRRGIASYSDDRIREELGFLLDRRVPQIEFYDTIFNVDEERTRSLLEFIIERNQGTSFIGEFMMEWLDDETIDLVGRANFVMMEVGLQSVNETTLRQSGRKTDLEKFRHNAQAVLSRTGVNLCVDAMYGLDHDSFEDFTATVDFIGTFEGTNGRRATPILFTTNVHPGTRMYRVGDGGRTLDGEIGGTVLESRLLGFRDTRQFYDLFYGYLFLRTTFPVTMNNLTGIMQREAGFSLSAFYATLADFLKQYPHTRAVFEQADWTEFRANPLLRFFLASIDKSYVLSFLEWCGKLTESIEAEITTLLARENDADAVPEDGDR